MDVAELRVLLSAENQASGALNDTQSKIQDVGDAADSAGEKSGGLLSNLGGLGGAAVLGGVGLLGGALAGMVSNASEAQQVSAQLDAALASTGGRAGMTKDAILDLSSQLSAANGMSEFGDEAITTGQTVLLKFQNLSQDVFPQVTQTMVDMASRMGGDTSAAAQTLGRALNDPAKGLSLLSRQGITFSDEQTALITKLQETGDMAGAQKIILDELGKTYGGAAAAGAQTFAGKMTTLKDRFGEVLEGLGTQLLPVITQFADFLGSPAVMGTIETLGTALSQGIGGAFQFIGGVLNVAGPPLMSLFQFLQDNAVPAAILIGSVVASQIVPAFIAWGTTMLTTTIPALIALVAPAIAAAAPFVALGAIIAGLWIAFQNNFLGIGDLVSGVWAIVQPIIQPFIDAFQTFWNTMTSGGDIMGAIGQLFADLGAAIAAAGPQILPALASIGQMLWNWVLEAAPQVLAALGTLFSNIVTWIGENGPGILATLGQWAAAFIQWVGDMIPQVLAGLGNLISGIFNWIVENGPGILAQLGQWAIAFIQWIGPMIPPFLAELGKIALGILQWIADTLPVIVGKLLEWGLAFIQWIAPQIPVLLGELGKLIVSLLQWLADQIPGILAKLGEWGQAFLNWVGTDVLPFIGAKLAEFGTAIWNWITQTASDIVTKAAEIGKGLIDGLVNKIHEMWTNITQFGADLLTFIQGIPGQILDAVVSIGSSIINGIVQGLENAGDAIWNFIQGICNDVLDGIKNFFGIGSPSKLMADMGEFIMQGWSGGIADGGADVVSAMAAVAKDVAAVPADVAFDVAANARRNGGAIGDALGLTAGGAIGAQSGAAVVYDHPIIIGGDLTATADPNLHRMLVDLQRYDDSRNLGPLVGNAI